MNLTFQQAIQEVGVVIPNSQRFLQTFTRSYSFKPTILYKPKIQWINQATEFVERAHKQLLDNNEILNYLHNHSNQDLHIFLQRYLPFTQYNFLKQKLLHWEQ